MNATLQTKVGLLEFLRPHLTVLWREWPMDMQVTGLRDLHGTTTQFSLHGTCPHCRHKTVFICISDNLVHQEPLEGKPGWEQWCSAMRCQGCKKFILGIVWVKATKLNARPAGARSEYHHEFKYVDHYPVGTSDDSVAEEVPPHIAKDFREALRCRWVNCYNATVEMCRRAIEASCMEFGAGAKLSAVKKIDWVYKQRRINKTLKTAAHAIRLGGNIGAHPHPNPITPEESDAVIEFTRHYLETTYM